MRAADTPLYRSTSPIERNIPSASHQVPMVAGVCKKSGATALRNEDSPSADIAGPDLHQSGEEADFIGEFW